MPTADSMPPQYRLITKDTQFDRLCLQLADQPVIAFDTEFVSEDRYRPQLCLIQVAAGDSIALVDPFQLSDTTPFWQLLATPGRIVVAHAAREEIRFCYRYTGRGIAGLFDTQLAAGFVGIEYPSSLSNLVQRLLNVKLSKGETRTNWRHRPLSDAQLRYAMHDVSELETMYRVLGQRIEEAGRMDWLEEETEACQQRVHEAEHRQGWHRVSGASGLKPRQLEIIRQLWLWRDDRARDLDKPPRWVLRDDLMVEIARGGSDDPKMIGRIRGMEFRHLRDHHQALAAAVAEALATPDDQLPQRGRGRPGGPVPMLAQFLNTSIACVCRQHQIAPMIVGNADDIRELIAFELNGYQGDGLPTLLQGWRGRIVGEPFRDLLRGRLAVKVADPNAKQPLQFVPTGQDEVASD